MSFADIDTPVSDEELSGMADEAPETDEVVEQSLGEAGQVSEEPAKVEPEEPAAEPAADKDQDRSPVIPRARFDEVNAKLHAEREQVEALRAQLAAQQAQQTPPTGTQVDIAALEDQHYDAMMGGDKETAVSIRAQINAELEARAESKAAERIAKQITEREAQSALDTVASKAVEQYPFLNVDSAEANSEAIAEVVELRDFYMFKGDPMHVALNKAVAKIGPSYATAPAAVAAAPLTDTRKAAALARNAADANAQPPAQVAGVGNRAAPPQPKVESQKDWEKLSEDERNSLLV
jgi:hypothetical protein